LYPSGPCIAISSNSTYTVYGKATCSGSSATTAEYSDSACTMAVSGASHVYNLTCFGSSGSYNKASCTTYDPKADTSNAVAITYSASGCPDANISVVNNVPPNVCFGGGLKVLCPSASIASFTVSAFSDSLCKNADYLYGRSNTVYFPLPDCLPFGNNVSSSAYTCPSNVPTVSVYNASTTCTGKISSTSSLSGQCAGTGPYNTYGCATFGPGQFAVASYTSATCASGFSGNFGVASTGTCTASASPFSGTSFASGSSIGYCPGGSTSGSAPPTSGSAPPTSGSAPPTSGSAPPTSGSAPPTSGSAPPTTSSALSLIVGLFGLSAVVVTLVIF